MLKWDRRTFGERTRKRRGRMNREQSRERWAAFAVWLRGQIDAVGMSLGDVEQATGVAKSALSYVLRLETRPSVETVLRIAMFFGSSPKELLEKAGYDDLAELFGEGFEPGNMYDFLARDPTISPEYRAIVMYVIGLAHRQALAAEACLT